MPRSHPLFTLLLCTAANAVLAAGCMTQPNAPMPVTKPASFQAYAQATRQWIRERRHFQAERQDDEVAWNAPFEVLPATPSRKGLLLFHGLGDSPWSFVDIAQDLAAQGYVVRAALLPGHGTRPSDLIDVRLEDWQQTVREQVALMHQDFPEVYLGGFSTGANLALEYAMTDAHIRGLVLFSPAFRSDEPLDWVTPWLARVKTWMFSPNGSDPQQSSVRYLNVPTNGFAQFYRSSVAVRRFIERRDFDRPVSIVLAEHDSVVDVHHVRELFDRRFTHPSSRLIWYGRDHAPSPSSQRVLTRTDYLPEERISQFSHMGVLFSPDNPLYGRSGTERLCGNGQGDQDTARCEAGESVWYSDWGHREPGKVHARLTFNPYFVWQSHIIREVLSAADAGSLSQTPGR